MSEQKHPFKVIEKQNPLNLKSINQKLFDGNTPQDVTARPGENAIFIVYSLKQSPDSIDKEKDVCTNFAAMIRSMRNRFPYMQFS